MIKRAKTIFLLSFFILLFFVGAKSTLAAYFSFSPSSKNVTVGESFTVSVLLDTQGQSTDGADAIILYDSGKLSVTSASLASLYENNVTEDYSIAGKVTLRATSAASTSFTGSGTFAQITFKAISDGDANVNFQFTAGSTTDSNVAQEGSDLLTSVSSATYTISTTGGTGGTTLPETGLMTPTILLASLGLLFILLPFFI